MNEKMPCHITDMPDEEDERALIGWPREPECEDREDRHMMPYDEFTNAMAQVRLSQRDIAKLTGKDRRTVWRWQTGRTSVPAYAWTIVRDRKKIRELTLELCK